MPIYRVQLHAIVTVQVDLLVMTLLIFVIKTVPLDARHVLIILHVVLVNKTISSMLLLGVQTAQMIAITVRTKPSVLSAKVPSFDSQTTPVVRVVRKDSLH